MHNENGYFVAVDADGPYLVTATEAGGVVSGTASVDVSAGGLACDYDMSGKVDLVDFSDLAWFWMATDCDGSNNFCGGVDHVGDGDVDFFDWVVFANAWQSTGDPPSANWNPQCDISSEGVNGVIDI